jgi:uncharacterized membrane protein
MYFARQTKIKYFIDNTAVYRRHNGSISSSSTMLDSLKFFKSSYNLRLHFIDIYGCKPSTLQKLYFDYHNGLLYYNYKLIDYSQAKKAFAKLNFQERTIFNYLQLIGSRNKVLNFIVKILIKILNNIK